jgi:heptosyltransferase-2
MSRTLVIAPQWIGDAVMSQPLAARLAARGERVTVAALPWVAPVYRAMPEVAEVVELPFQHGRLDWTARRAMGREWRGRFDAAYVLPNSIKSALLPWLARIPRRVGYHGEGRWGLLTQRLPNPGGRPPMVAFYSALAAAGDGPHPEPQAHGDAPPPQPRLVVEASRTVQAAAQAQLEPGRYWVFAPGAEYGPAKRWPVAHYAALARSLHARGTAAPGQPADADLAWPIVLLGSAKEADLCDQIAALAPQSCRVLAGRTTLDEAIALISGARGMVSNDSGLMHVAAAFGLPQVAVFGSTSPEHTPPHNPRAAVLWLKDELKLDCMPCFQRECRFGHLRCLQEVAPARVEAALRERSTP